MKSPSSPLVLIVFLFLLAAFLVALVSKMQPTPKPAATATMSADDLIKKCLRVEGVVSATGKQYSISGGNYCKEPLRALDLTVKFYDSADVRIGVDIISLASLVPRELFAHRYDVPSSVLTQGTPVYVKVAHE